MPRRQAIDIALDAHKKPGSVSLLSVGPLPDGVKDLLHIVADGEWREATTEHAYQRHSAEEVRAASANFLAAVLFDRASDPYRVLGLPPKAPADDVRDNKRLLLKWLHPDRNPHPRERAYLSRVLDAAEAIENGRTSLAPEGRSRGRSMQAMVRPRPRPTQRPVDARRVVSRTLQGTAHTAKLAALTAGILLVGLVTWRYFMDEPIGASLARYSEEALGITTW